MPDTPIPVKKEELKATVPATRRTGVDLWHSFHSEIDRLFDRFSPGVALPSFGRFFHPAARVDSGFELSIPAVDATEEETAYRITAEIPGMSEKDVEVNLSDGMITIKGEKREEKEQKGKNYYLSERRYGSFQRSFDVPDSVDRDKIDATFDKGVLTLMLPKKPEAVRQQKKIEVKAKQA
ncbi:MAG TPA: Hsp20/alpha crystallin family protein [Candidatus Sulfotelmatobacter sp.]|nr:Hsp20/alpha crystallin family protein [Candidatus Sulfotelmatobacter sp.]